MKLTHFSCVILAAFGVSSVSAQNPTAPATPPAEQTSVASDNWHIGLGMSYRNFRKPRFKSSNVPDFTGVFSAASPEIVEYTSENISKYGANGLETVNVIHYSGGSVAATGHYGLEESLAPAVSFAYGLYQKDNMEISLVTNLQYFSLDSSSRRGSYAGGDEYTRLQSVMYGIPAGAEYDEPYGETKATSYLNGSARSRFAMDLYVLDLGLSMNYIFQNGLQAFVAAGPSISLADMESASSALVSSGSALGRSSGSDNDIDYVLGVYASVGAAYWITEKVGLSLELRYDEGFNDADTKFVSQNLDAIGGMLKCLVRF